MTTRTEASHDVVTSLKAKAIDLVKRVVEMTTAAGSGHPTSASSLAHLVACLLYHHMRYDPARPDAREADRLVLSEGHACPIVYAAAADIGIAVGTGDDRRPMTLDDAMTLRDLESPIDGHPNPAEGFPFFPAATGSLGQGLSIAAGLAIASRLDGLDRRVYAIMGDGESREGQIWEALELIRDQRLAAVCPIFNANGFGQTGPVAPGEEPSGIRRKLEALGYECVEIDGHDPKQILDALERHSSEASEDPLRLIAIVARTVKGWGYASKVSGGRHGKAFSAKDEAGVLAEIEAERRSLGANGSFDLRPRSPSAVAGDEGEQTAAKEATWGFPRFREGLEENGEAERLDSRKISPRRALGLALRSIARRRSDVVVLDGDVSNSTYTELVADDPELSRRFVQCYIAEQNMISCAAGLAAGGKVPVAATFGKFVVRGYDQLELALISRAGLKIIATHTGVTPASDGPSQMALSDVAFFRAWSCVDRGDGLPVVHVLQPCDGVSAWALARVAIDAASAVYLRAFRPDVPFLYGEDAQFSLRGHNVLRSGTDALVIASGYMVHEALHAVNALECHGVHTTLIDLYSLPFDVSRILALAAECGGRIVTVEDNFPGGIGSALAEALLECAGTFKLEQLCVRRVPKSARTHGELIEHLGLSSARIVNTVVMMLEGAER